MGFYRLLATWLLRLAYPPLAQGQMPFVPLPEPAPVQFRCLPVSTRHTALCNLHVAGLLAVLVLRNTGEHSLR